jgi:hypothetical protein
MRTLPSLLLLLVVYGHTARADDNRPLTLQVTENAAGDAELRWKIQLNLDAVQAPVLDLPADCMSRAATRAWSDGFGHWRATRWHCTNGLAGKTIAIRFPSMAPSLATIARLELRGSPGTTTLVLQPGQSHLLVPAPRGHRNVFAEFLRLGIEHVWRGMDHLLFVAGLVFIAGTWRRVLATLTGFTIAHSLTLALAALDILRLPARAIEAVIALSIILLAVEIARGPRDTLTWRHPVAVASSFGLLHGLGFAAVLRDVGLPQKGLVTGLLAFNLGIELGQVLFAVPLLLAFMLVRRHAAHGLAASGVQRAAGYAVGILASYWMFARLLA